MQADVVMQSARQQNFTRLGTQGLTVHWPLVLSKELELNRGLTSSLAARSSAATAKPAPAAAFKPLLLVWENLWLCRLDLHIDHISGTAC